MRYIKGIAIHCTAGYGDVESIKRYWKEVLGWRNYGYHGIVELDGKVHWITPLSKVSNGIKGHNKGLINLAYIGGVEKGDYTKPKDTRTEKQKAGLLDMIRVSLEWVKQHQDIQPEFFIKGHRDFSEDKNGNGVVDPWERIKECPSFDAIPEYSWILQ